MNLHVAHLVLYIRDNYWRAMSIPQMAALAHLSTSRLTHLFTRHTGVSPSMYLKEVRMQKASQLLRETCYSIKEIIYVTGFNDASHFVRDFEDRYGETPSAYRRRHRLTAGFSEPCFNPADLANKEQNPPIVAD